MKRGVRDSSVRLILWSVLTVAIATTCLFLVASAETHQTADIIHTIAGSFPEQTRALLALLPGPLSVATDRFGNTYIAVPEGETVLKLTRTRDVVPFAGNGIADFGGDGEPARRANLDIPVGVATDKSGNVFIADLLNSRIRRVDARTGIITTYAGNGIQGFGGDGGPATSASLYLNFGSGPNGSAVALDGAGNLFISDMGNNRIRRVDAVTGIINTVAGTGTPGFSGDNGPAVEAQLNAPSSVAVTSSGTYYINDSFNFVIRRVDGSTGTITTYAGQGGSFSFCGDNGPAINACFFLPEGLALDKSGDLFIADSENDRVRRVDVNTQIITTVAGNGGLGFSGDGAAATTAALNLPGGVVVDESGNLLIADVGNNRIREVSAYNQIIRTIAGGGTGGDGGPALRATSTDPFGVTADATGNVYFADAASNRIRKVELSSGIIKTVAGNGFANFGGDGGPGREASLNFPETQVAVDSAGNVFFDDVNNFRVRRIDAATGVITTVAGDGSVCVIPYTGNCGDGGPAVDASLFAIFGVIVDASGNLYISDEVNSIVRRVDGATGIITTVAGNATAGFGGDGGPATEAELNLPFGLGVDKTGDLFIADGANARIRRVDAVTGVISTVAGNGTEGYSGDGGPATSASLNLPTSAIIDGEGNLFIADVNNGVVRFVSSSTGIITTIAGNGVFGFSGDGGPATEASLDFTELGLDNSARVLIADAGNNRIRRFPFTPCSSDCGTPAGVSVADVKPDSLKPPMGSRLAATTARLAPQIRLAQMCRVTPHQPACSRLAGH
jgi:trimeric autotransporter adhesin